MHVLNFSKIQDPTSNSVALTAIVFKQRMNIVVRFSRQQSNEIELTKKLPIEYNILMIIHMFLSASQYKLSLRHTKLPLRQLLLMLFLLIIEKLYAYALTCVSVLELVSLVQFALMPRLERDTEVL